MVQKTRNNKYLRFSALLFLVLISSQTLADDEDTDQPLWELGFGAGVIHQSYYTGTKQTRQFAFPAVIPTYRGKMLKSDDEGVRAQLFKNERFTLNVSADLNLAVESDDVDLRNGMDDVENILQIGPSFELSLDKKENSELILDVAIRGAFEVGSDIDTAGLMIYPNLFYKRTFPMLDSQWDFGATAGPQFGTSRYNNIYYGVDSEFATADRNAFKAESGYAGSRLQLSLNSNNNKRMLLWFMRYENINGASFDDSPLVETNHNLTLGFIYTYNFFKSKQRVSP